MRVQSVRPEDGPSVFKEVLEDLPSFWGERDVRAQHQPVWFRQFASDAVIVREDGVLLGYLLGTVTAHELAYVQLIASMSSTSTFGGQSCGDTVWRARKNRCVDSRTS